VGGLPFSCSACHHHLLKVILIRLQLQGLFSSIAALTGENVSAISVTDSQSVIWAASYPIMGKINSQTLYKFSYSFPRHFCVWAEAVSY